MNGFTKRLALDLLCLLDYCSLIIRLLFITILIYTYHQAELGLQNKTVKIDAAHILTYLQDLDILKSLAELGKLGNGGRGPVQGRYS